MVVKVFMIWVLNLVYCYCMLFMVERMYMWFFIIVVVYCESLWSICDKCFLLLMVIDILELDEVNRYREVWYLVKVLNILLMNR